MRGGSAASELHLEFPDLQQQLQLLKQRSVVGTVAGSLGKPGSDPTQAVLNLAVTQQPWRGDQHTNDNPGSGEWRSVVLQKPTFLTDGDVFQFYEN